MAFLYSNENFPLPVVKELRVFGHDVVTIQERGRAYEKLPDPMVLQTAMADGRAVLTLNRLDFLRLHRLIPSHAGIIVCTVDRDFTGQAERIHVAIGDRDDLSGLLIRVNRSAR